MFSTMLRAVISATRPLYHFVYPPFCHVCGDATSQRIESVCENCWRSIKLVTPENSLLHQATERLCVHGSCSAVVADCVFEEDGALQQIIHMLKYGGMTSLGIALGKRLGHRLEADFTHAAINGIIPIPLHRTKERERGYNQAVLIARGVSSSTGIPLLNSLLRRRKFTVTQTRLTAEERRRNVEGAFVVNISSYTSVRGKRFVLVDDVITTGATTEAAARVLVAAGALPPVACAVALAE